MIEDAAPRPTRGHLLNELGREDLDAYGVVELRERIQSLHDEIERTEARLRKKESGRDAADALFRL